MGCRPTFTTTVATVGRPCGRGGDVGAGAGVGSRAEMNVSDYYGPVQFRESVSLGPSWSPSLVVARECQGPRLRNQILRNRDVLPTLLAIPRFFDASKGALCR